MTAAARAAALALAVLAGGTHAAQDGGTPAVFLRCYDGDTCTFDIPGWPPVVGRAIPVRLRGVDTPEIRGRCPEETRRAKAARDFVIGILERAETVELHGIERGKWFRLVADVRADGESLSARILGAGHGRPYDGGARQPWCAAVE